MMNQIALILACACFAIGAVPELSGSRINWTNAGLALVTLSLILE